MDPAGAGPDWVDRLRPEPVIYFRPPGLGAPGFGAPGLGAPGFGAAGLGAAPGVGAVGLAVPDDGAAGLAADVADGLAAGLAAGFAAGFAGAVASGVAAGVSLAGAGWDAAGSWAIFFTSSGMASDMELDSGADEVSAATLALASRAATSRREPPVRSGLA